jgi:hypothetical protein
VQHGNARLRQRDPRCVEQLACLLQREPQVGGPDLGQLAREAQAMQAEMGIVARREHDVERRRQAGQQQLELGERVGRAQLVQVVDHEHDALVKRGQIGDQALDHRAAVELRRGCGLLDRRVAVHCGPQRLDHRAPEALCVFLSTLDRSPGDAPSKLPMVDPGGQQQRLPAARRRRDNRDAARDRPVEDLEEPLAGHQPPAAEDGDAHAHPAIIATEGTSRSLHL